MMKFLIITFLLGSTIAKSQESRRFPMEESSLLWKITGTNMESDSYIFGTMHLIKKEYFFFPRKLKKLVSKTEQLVMEIADFPNQTDAIKYVTLDEGSFFDFFNTAQIDTILTWAKTNFFIEETAFRSAFSKIKPFVIIQMATQNQFIGKTESYEITLNEIAKKKGIKTKGLETFQQQINFFDQLTNKQQVEMVMSRIRDSEKSIDMIIQIQKMYVSQNIDALYQMITNDSSAISEEQLKFLDDRNKNWIAQIIKLIKKNTFIAIGAGHLGGPSGVIRLLEKKGYTLTPIKL